MVRIRESVIFVMVSLCLALVLTGCNIAGGAFLKPQSHFDFPNSNVVPIGRVTGEASDSSIFIADMFRGDLEEQAVQNALKQKGGDLLIDYTMYYEVKMIPLMVINLFTTTVRVEGTAAKMEIGEKMLK